MTNLHTLCDGIARELEIILEDAPKKCEVRARTSFWFGFDLFVRKTDHGDLIFGLCLGHECSLSQLTAKSAIYFEENLDRLKDALKVK